MTATSFLSARGTRAANRKPRECRVLGRRFITRSRPGATGSGLRSEELGSPAGHARPLALAKKLHLAQDSVKLAVKISNSRQMQPSETLGTGRLLGERSHNFAAVWLVRVKFLQIVFRAHTL